MDMNEYCRLFYNTVFLPITYYDNHHKIICSYPNMENKPDLTTVFLPDLLQANKNPAYFIAKSFSYYGIIQIQATRHIIVIGPVFSTPVSTAAVKSFLHECMLSLENETSVIQFFQTTPIVTFNQILSTLAYLHFNLNHEKLNLIQHFNISDNAVGNNISEKHSNQIYDAKEEQQFHNTYHFEQQYLNYIQNGEPEKLKKLVLEGTSTIKEGTIADNALRQSKNILITSATLTTRSAILGGMDIEQAYQLSDLYISQCERTQSLTELSNLQYTMILDFANRVAQSKIPKGISKEIFECIQFISKHTNEVIHVDDVAASIGKSRSYVSRKFKQELGFDLSAFIMRCKLEEAKSLLTYSDKSLSEISHYLCFSSQAYFQNVFKKKYGMTPMQYRNGNMEHNHNSK